MSRSDAVMQKFHPPGSKRDVPDDACRSGTVPGSGEARSFHAAMLQRAGSAVWPPGCSGRCWCGSERKHSKSWRPVLVAAGDSS